jgi:xylose isomerase
MFKEVDLKVNTVTCNLHGNPIFRRGGLTNPDPSIRELARLKVERTLYIGNMLGAQYFTYWVARDGFEVAWGVSWLDVYKWIIEALNHVYNYQRQNHFSYKGGSIEPKPNEPRGHMFIPTAGHAVGLINALEYPSFWGVNPELRQHEGMTLIDPITTLGYLLSLKKLLFLHFGNQINGQFDNDFPPMVGPEGQKETIQMFWLLQQFGWEGIIEFDCHALRSELDPDGPEEFKMRFIRNCCNALDMALTLAGRIPDPAHGIQHFGESDLDLRITAILHGIDPGSLR